MRINVRVKAAAEGWTRADSAKAASPCMRQKWRAIAHVPRMNKPIELACLREQRTQAPRR
eukprot:5028862-Pleurochrysis_carterae.AAC.1